MKTPVLVHRIGATCRYKKDNDQGNDDNHAENRPNDSHDETGVCLRPICRQALIRLCEAHLPENDCEDGQNQAYTVAAQ